MSPKSQQAIPLQGENLWKIRIINQDQHKKYPTYKNPMERITNVLFIYSGKMKV